MPQPFDKFTERARRVLSLSQDEAHRLNHHYIGTEHLLLGLVREGDGVAARVLINLGVNLPRLRAEVVKAVVRGESPVEGEIGLTPQAKKALELAVDEGRRLNHPYVGTEHLLLGVVREDEGIAAGLLESMGMTLENIRQKVYQVTSATPLREVPPKPDSTFEPDPFEIPIPPRRPSTDPPKPLRLPFERFTDRARTVLQLAQEEATRFNHNYIGTEHILLGLVREGDGVAARVMRQMGVQLPKVRSAVEFIIGRGEAVVTGDVGLTPRAKKVLELSVDECSRLDHDNVGTEHLLLGLVREGEGIAAGVLESLGVNLAKVRRQVEMETMDDYQIAEFEAAEASLREWRRLNPRLPDDVNWRDLRIAIDLEADEETYEQEPRDPGKLVHLGHSLGLPMTNDLLIVLDRASDEAIDDDPEFDWSGTLLAALAWHRMSAGAIALGTAGIHHRKMLAYKYQVAASRGERGEVGWTGRRILARAGRERRDETEKVGTVHLLLALLRDEGGTASVLIGLGPAGPQALTATLEVLLALDVDPLEEWPGSATGDQ